MNIVKTLIIIGLALIAVVSCSEKMQERADQQAMSGVIVE